MPTMRRFLPCLILLLLPLAAAQASEAPASKQRNDCVYTDATDADAVQARPASTARPSSAAAKPAAPSGGGNDSDLVPRLRMPKWHSFLPGMFR
ncbi:hypothetical protein ISN34_02960 [Xanthomonas translucens pv. translucens]|uniref:Secreted protein n=3 Tax=Xanthomonas campestris pv. translucens TaxID=343 RepID=A0A109HP87_XANCT|nr:hypothetical protein OZ12_02315 [Xanthomonas translucens pv. translucens]KWV15755.1 hypothetical protein ATB53_11175 [Xanthomonas translucens]UKE58062.1 hypothetical protein KFS86_19195 [Xanthomonas translucens pv. hordei]KWV15768.1 hypothetical protein ATB54_09675 [Xanthomonas translucens]MQS43756.1 hypothetical protein [Xanthomonas translucens pv. translucens]